MTKHTAKALSAESGAPSERTETQGDLWKEIAEEGYDSLDGAWETLAQRGKPFEELVKGEDLPATAKQETPETPEPNATASTAPIIEDGKTLDELVKGDTIGESLTKWLRSQGATDQEIWQFMVEN